jgi:Ca-activated chloride channel family protein
MRHKELFSGVAMLGILGAFSFLTPFDPPATPSGQAQLPFLNGKNFVSPQTPAPGQLPQDPAESFKIQTEMVQLDVKVIDSSGRPVLNLKKSDFIIFEDKVRQDIESVSREEVPISLGLVIDTSGSMRPKMRTVTQAALDLVRQMKPNDEAFLAQFKTETELVQSFTQDPLVLEEAMKELYVSGGTALLDAIIATADYAQENGKRRRKALIVISDGLEKNSSAKEKQALQVMKEDEVQLYVVGFLEERGGRFLGMGANHKARDLLNRLTDDSGGKAYFPEAISELPQIAAEIAGELRSQYVISYYPSNNKSDGAFRNVRVTVNSQEKKKLAVRARQGYYARNEKNTMERHR